MITSIKRQVLRMRQKYYRKKWDYYEDKALDYSYNNQLEKSDYYDDISEKYLKKWLEVTAELWELALNEGYSF